MNKIFMNNQDIKKSCLYKGSEPFMKSTSHISACGFHNTIILSAENSNTSFSNEPLFPVCEYCVIANGYYNKDMVFITVNEYQGFEKGERVHVEVEGGNWYHFKYNGKGFRYISPSVSYY